MRDILFQFQEDALRNLHSKIKKAHLMWSESDPQVISFSAPTGAGKTIIMTTLIEEILYGSDELLAEPDAVFVWLSDSPSLNEQSRMKMESKSDKLRVRDLVTIDSSFQAEYLEGGCVYFLNTQKLGSDKLLTARSEKRNYTIWETLTNTARRFPQKLYFIIDEAHRGTLGSAREENKAHSIMQKFILGSPDDGLCTMPLIIGVTATPMRFDNLVSGNTTSTIQKVQVPPEEVRESGLLKDRIIIHYPTIALGADMTMLQSAIENWQQKCIRWERYCARQDEKKVEPVLVIQVEDGSAHEATNTDLATCVDMIQQTIGRHLVPGEIVHTFNDRGDLTIGDTVIQKIEPARIEDSTEVKIVIFKQNLSTGWDCPRAETMMSFRSAQDYTYIAQLLGRMIRTPLARRVMEDAELNNVGLFLPFYNEATVKQVIEALKNSEAVLPADSGSSSDMKVLRRDPQFSDVFNAIERLELVTAVVESAHKINPIKAYMQMARNLTMDDIDRHALKNARYALLDKMDAEVSRIKASGAYDEAAARVTGFPMGAVIYDYGESTYLYDSETREMTVIEFDIRRHFELAGKILSEGLHKDYWRRHFARQDDVAVQTEVMVLVEDATAMDSLVSFAEAQFNALYNQHKFDIRSLTEKRKEAYQRLIRSASTSTESPWDLPQTIDFNINDSSAPFPKHMYFMEDGSFLATLNNWETGVLQEELAKPDVVCWIRNLDRKKWALAVPYEVSGSVIPMYPDLIVVRAVTSGYTVDILEPHDPSRKDNYPKAVGLAKFASKHWDKYGRIQLIRKMNGPDGNEHFYRLDMSDLSVCQRVLGISSNQELDHIFDESATRDE